ncbi:hypothetical protein CORC01_04850 [Colletotrichum orchidophilum]|uniref:C2H2-type domain-containing protein n=1 Tax=Colletotrichum orchidophilum TaxID=1209926 RepID=A0A1G4BEP1_9PEZI|nr:uncharacterized protein CORC01_04850 [Colletotrichum orchidophilum]OHE99949.1 hypothetical protein CORC01_04850 [Colletotrichum orchidophilum]
MELNRYAEEAVQTFPADLLIDSGPSQPQEPRPYVCTDPDCDRSYDQRHELNRHMKKHSRPCACPVQGCAMKFPDKKGLDRHTATHGIGRGEFDCPDCPKKFTRSDNLTRHRQKRCKG